MDSPESQRAQVMSGSELYGQLIVWRSSASIWRADYGVTRDIRAKKRRSWL